MVGDERGVVYSCPVSRLVDTLVSTSPSATALKRGPVGIVCNGLHVDILEQKVFPRGLQCLLVWWCKRCSSFVLRGPSTRLRGPCD